MTHLRIHLLGQISIQQGSTPIAELSAKALEMFCYLLLYRDRPHTRETLAAALWADASTPRAQKYLRQTLWQLQTMLDRHQNPNEGGALLLLDPGWIRVNPRGTWWLDVTGLEQAYQFCREIPGSALTDEQAQLVEAAIALYRGDLLETWHQDWCIYERERLQLTYLALLDKLVAYCAARRLYARGIDYAQRILRCDIARESTYQQLMRLHYLSGDRTTALREYARCVQALKREFDLPPMQATVDLYEQIRAERLVERPVVRQTAEQAPTAIVDAGTIQVGRPPVGPLAGPQGDLQQQVAQLQGNLAEFQVQMRQEMKTVLYLLNLQIETSQQIWRETY
jgi:DNA-binding SARP family transcriptional activator